MIFIMSILISDYHLNLQDLDAFSAAVVVSIAFSFIPASFAVAIVKVCF